MVSEDARSSKNARLCNFVVTAQTKTLRTGRIQLAFGLIFSRRVLDLFVTGLFGAFLMANAESSNPPHPVDQRLGLGPGEHSLMLKVGDLNRYYIVHVPSNCDSKNLKPTFDPGATADELRFLARIYTAVKDAAYQAAFCRGLDDFFKANTRTEAGRISSRRARATTVISTSTMMPWFDS